MLVGVFGSQDDMRAFVISAMPALIPHLDDESTTSLRCMATVRVRVRVRVRVFVHVHACSCFPLLVHASGWVFVVAFTSS